MTAAVPRLVAPRQAAAADAAARPFARVDLDAAAAWGELEGAGGAYQSRRFVEAWAAAFGARLAVIVARDAAGAVVAVLPVCIKRFGPMRVADFAGGRWANYHMGLFRPDVAWTAEDIAALLHAAGRTAGIDLFAFTHQPLRWAGRDNPLAKLPRRPSPNAACATALPDTHAAWVDAHFSRATQKKFRKKARKLEAFGPVAHVRAGDAAQAERFLDVLFSHKAAQARARGEPDEFASPAVRGMLRRLSSGDAPTMEMHALMAGERVAATFGALRAGDRLSGLVISYDADREIAAATPGEWLLIEVVRDAMARGVRTFDLGTGSSRYKGEICEIEEELFDSAVAVAWRGRLAAPAFVAARAAQGRIKRRTGLLHYARRLRAALGFL